MKLRENEKVIMKANLHWSNLLFTGILASTLGLFSLISFAKSPSGGAFILCVLTFMPLLLKWLDQNAKLYLITDQRVYVKQGIFSVTKVDISLKKINDITSRQSLIQSIFGAGDLMIFLGNDKPTLLNGIDHPDEFRERISGLVNQSKDASKT